MAVDWTTVIVASVATAPGVAAAWYGRTNHQALKVANDKLEVTNATLATANNQTVGQLLDAAETRAVNALTPEERTHGQQDHIEATPFPVKESD